MKLIFLRYVIPGVIIVGIWGCKTTQKTASPTSSVSTDSSEVDYTLIYVLHGDGNYLYHDEEGKRLQADEKQLEQAISVAEQSHHGEVFIFHQRPEEQILWLFPKKDRLFLHYKNGKQLQRKKYSPRLGGNNFENEASLYHQFRSWETARTFFLYYGHEVPGDQTVGYFQSRPETSFGIQQFKEGLDRFLDSQKKFDLTVLSTCDNGTPAMVQALHGQTQYLLASPENLHLSHIDAEDLLQLEDHPDLPTAEIAHTLAETSFDRLSGFLQTVVTLAVYDMDAAASSMMKLSKKYAEYHSSRDEKSVEQENVDCATLPFWDEDESYSKGVEIFFKPPNFGPQANRKSHSGWGCQP